MIDIMGMTMKFKLFVLTVYTLSIGNLFYNAGFDNGIEQERVINTQVSIRTNKISYQEGCEVAMQYNCYFNTCDTKPMEVLKDYCAQSAERFSK
jgi:hypothetical protein